MKIGIDFGTTFSLPAAIVEGQSVTLLPRKSFGMPSVFYYDKKGVQVGDSANEWADERPENAVREVKMEIRKPKNEWNFAPIGRAFPKVEVIGHIFKEIVRLAEREMEQLGLVSRKVSGAVITVPAKFELREKAIIQDAARFANIDVLDLLSEPAAAAISYFNTPFAGQTIKNGTSVLVYDIGGGTCDVAVVRYDKDNEFLYEVLAADMIRLAGKDWDKALMDLARKKFQESDGINSSTFDKGKGYFDLRGAAIKTKETLTDVEHALLRAVNNEGRRLHCEITRAEFEDATKKLLTKTMAVVDKVMSEVNVDISHIVLCGGSSNMPQIEKAMRERFPKIPIELHKPERAIAIGAAYFAERYSTGNSPEKTLNPGKAPFSYGIRLIENFEKYNDENRLRIFNIIYKDSTPYFEEMEKTSSKLRDNQAASYKAIYESECTDSVYMPSGGKKIGELRISDLESTTADDTIVTKMILKPDMLYAYSKDLKTGNDAKTEIKLDDY